MNTNIHEEKILYKDLSYKITGLAMEVYNKLGYGFLEKVYENSLMILFEQGNIRSQQQAPVKVYFEGATIGEYYADILVEDKIILELKTIEKLTDIHKA